jgi:hypothetical protein
LHLKKEIKTFLDVCDNKVDFLLEEESLVVVVVVLVLQPAAVLASEQ